MLDQIRHDLRPTPTPCRLQRRLLDCRASNQGFHDRGSLENLWILLDHALDFGKMPEAGSMIQLNSRSVFDQQVRRTVMARVKAFMTLTK